MHNAPSSASWVSASWVKGLEQERRALRLGNWIGSGLLAVALSACNNTSTPNGGTLPVGSFQTNPDTNLGFIVEANDGGSAPEVRLVQTYFGRLVRVIAFDSSGAEVVIHTNFVMNPNDLGNGIDYEVRTSQITGEQSLVVFRRVDVPAELAQLQQFVKLLGDQLRVVADNGFVGAGAYTMVPRNAAFVMQFSDLIDPATITDQSVKVVVGVPTTFPFESRLLADANHGDIADPDGDGTSSFYSTRVIVDPTVSELESFSTSPPLPVNTTGFPASIEQVLSNIQVRIPTRRSALSTDVLLQNPTGHTLASSNNGSVDFGTNTRDVVRAMRAGGNQAVTGDPFNGYLRDDSAPRIVGSLDLSIDMPPQPSPTDPFRFLLPQVTFQSAFCAQSPLAGDIITQPGLFAEIDLPAGQTITVDAGVAVNVPVRLVVIPDTWNGDPGLFISNGAAPAQYLVPYDDNEDRARAICFLEITPPGNGGANAPGTGIQPNSTYTVRFNEPIDSSSLTVFDSFGLTRREVPQEPIDYVPGSVQRSVDLQEFTFTPELALAHTQGTAETYFVRLSTETFAPTDLSGNEVLSGLQPVPFSLLSSSSSQRTGGRVVRFDGADEESPKIGETIGGVTFEEIRPEWGGQHVYDVGRQLIRPRPVTRSQLVADRNQRLPGAMQQQPTGQTLPLSTFGAKTQIIYRMIDFDADLPLKIDDRIDGRLDGTQINIDVEGVSLAPQSGGVIFESYARFRMSMTHCFFAPDEALTPQGAIAFPGSGLTSTFENNYLSIVEDPATVVHEDFRGYQVIPGNVFQTPSGTNMVPLPQNRGLAPADKRYYTWRDSSIRTRGGPGGAGVYPIKWHQLTGNATPIFPGPGMPPAMPLMDCGMTACANQFFSAGFVESVALPLLIEFDCFASSGAQTQNLFDTSMAHPTQTVPNFRAFSAGGFDTSGNQVFVDPDLEVQANGGFNPTGTPPGVGTPGVDNTFYLGALDLVVRVSRSASVYFPAINPLLSDGNPQTSEDPRFPNPTFFPAVLTPRPEDQPTGTSIAVTYRGASIIPDMHRSRADAREIDPYGDFYPDFAMALENVCDGSISHDPIRCDGAAILQNEGITFHTNDTWRTNVADLTGAQFIQIGLTFTNNVESGLTASLSSIALSWAQQ
ncbi:MAG: Ig-like domain-containing protein [Planctomycetota bacterium]